MNMIIDDCRQLGCDIIIRTAQAGKDTLYNIVPLFDSFGKPLIECLYIDYDLGCKETGYDVIKWAIAHNCLPANIQIVSTLPVGKESIACLLFDNGYTSFDNTNFVKEK